MTGAGAAPSPTRSRLTIQHAASAPASTTTTSTPRTSNAHGSRRSTVRCTWCTPSGSSRRRSPRANQPGRVQITRALAVAGGGAGGDKVDVVRGLDARRPPQEARNARGRMSLVRGPHAYREHVPARPSERQHEHIVNTRAPIQSLARAPRAVSGERTSAPRATAAGPRSPGISAWGSPPASHRETRRVVVDRRARRRATRHRASPRCRGGAAAGGPEALQRRRPGESGRAPSPGVPLGEPRRPSRAAPQATGSEPGCSLCARAAARRGGRGRAHGRRGAAHQAHSGPRALRASCGGRRASSPRTTSPCRHPRRRRPRRAPG